MTGSPKCSLSLRFSHQNPVHISPFPHTCYRAVYLLSINYEAACRADRSVNWAYKHIKKTPWP
jgi:hypothetical protein